MAKKGASKAKGNRTKVDWALEILGSSRDGLLQSDLRKQMGIDSSTCSKIVSRLQRDGLIRREKHLGSQTFWIRPVKTSTKACPAPPSRVKVPKSGKIDSYLTEIYLLYLLKGAALS
jgi:predicted transcriptional regulator